MKYNLSTIMKRAWKILRTVGNTFSQALKMSWQIAKFEQDFRETEYRTEERDKMEFRIWTNYGKIRAYYTCSWRSKYANNKNYNFIALV